jgi:uncharacterized protein (DUF1330 family)
LPPLGINKVTVTDDVAYDKYVALAGLAVFLYGGRLIALGARFVQLEGTGRSWSVIENLPCLISLSLLSIA